MEERGITEAKDTWEERSHEVDQFGGISIFNLVPSSVFCFVFLIGITWFYLLCFSRSQLFTEIHRRFSVTENPQT